VQGVTTSREHQAANDAADLIVFADGLEQGGFHDYAQRARVVARETIWLADMLQAERSARVAMQEARDRLLEMVAK
jgi:hypothetical protein